MKIKRALLSVSDKRHLVPLAEALHKQGVELLSTGGTARVLREEGFDVIDVSEITGFRECLDGRVKTLHPMVHGAILGRTSHPADREEMNEFGIEPIELVVVNLYPFKETVSKESVTPAIATENIDIGGPTMIRAAAKNFAHVAVLSSPNQYDSMIETLSTDGMVSFEQRRQWALEAFRHTTEYDTAISHYLSSIHGEELPEQWSVSLPKAASLRYGENPHQPAGVYGNPGKYMDCFHGKELSYNNYLDMDAALQLIAAFKEEDPTVAIFKHTVPCGVGMDPDSLTSAWKKAFSTDTVSPFGGIIVCNRELDPETAREIDSIFTEIIVAPSFHEDALELLTQKKNRRLVRLLEYPDLSGEFQFRSIVGGVLLQQPDTDAEKASTFKTVTKRSPNDQELKDLLLAWKIVRFVKSNAVVYVKDGQTVGIGTGQTSRVDSSEIAIRKAKKEGLSLEGSVLASDAFFPFADSIEAAADAGVNAVIQPGGSIRDEEVIQEADRRGLSMLFTGRRHFRH
ncbi:MAG: bifunctional phosphoribosylaminoimidazolecarboxamide formyltransferase/IMP cyclohydrolase [Bacteroidota bacterium]